MNADGRRAFLCMPCVPNPALVNSIQAGMVRPTVLPKHSTVRVGRTDLHASHSLCIYRGVYYCSVCGFHASVKPQHLASQCTVRGEAANRRVARFEQGLLPSNLKAWPTEVSKPGALLQLG